MQPKKEFEIKSYGKTELASIYLPHINPESAGKTFKRWIGKYPGLQESLVANGLNNFDKRYTPVHVQLIVESIGFP